MGRLRNNMASSSARSEGSLTALLADRVMGWKVGPGRFVKSGRRWIPDWRFAPFARVQDALLLLKRATNEYKLTRVNGLFTAEVWIAGSLGKAVGEPMAESITLAVLRALGLDQQQNGVCR